MAGIVGKNGTQWNAVATIDYDNHEQCKQIAHVLLEQRNKMYEMIEELSSELYIAIDEVNDQRASRINCQTESEPDYMDMQTIHEAKVLLAKSRGEKSCQ